MTAVQLAEMKVDERVDCLVVRMAVLWVATMAVEMVERKVVWKAVVLVAQWVVEMVDEMVGKKVA